MDADRWAKVKEEADRKAEERASRVHVILGVASCDKHGTSGINPYFKAGEPTALPWCLHCGTEAAEAQEQRLEAIVQEAASALGRWIENRHDPRTDWRNDFANALRDLVKEARRR